LYCLAIIVGAAAVGATIESVLSHRKADEITDEISFLHTTAADMMLLTIEDYNGRYGKYGVRIDSSELPEAEPQRTAETPSIGRRITLQKLYPLRNCKRDIGVVMGILASIASFASAILFEPGL